MNRQVDLYELIKECEQEKRDEEDRETGNCRGNSKEERGSKKILQPKHERYVFLYW